MQHAEAAQARKPTLEDVARAAGVSRALVSIVVRGAPGASEETRARVLAVAEDLGYRPDVRARLLARNTTHLLGVTYLVTSMHHADLLSPIYSTAKALGYEVILSGKTVERDERHAIDTLLGYRCDAILMLGPELPEHLINELATSLPVVLVGRRMVHMHGTIDTVRTDDDAGMRLAVEHLAGLGHTSIVHVDGGPGIKASDRRRGYRASMTRMGLRANVHVISGGEAGDDGRRAARDLLALDPRPTAVIAYNDDCAWGAMRTIADAGLTVPGDVSVVGYDGSQLSRLAPHELTTVRQDAGEMARISVCRAVGRLRGETVVEPNVVLLPTMALGETTAPNLTRIPDESVGGPW